MKALLEAVDASEVAGIGRQDGDAEDRWVISELLKPVLELPILIHLVIHHYAQFPQLIEVIELIPVQRQLLLRSFHHLLQFLIHDYPGIGKGIEDEKLPLIGERGNEDIEFRTPHP